MVSRTVGDERVLSKMKRRRRNCFRRASGAGWRISVGEFGRPRVSVDSEIFITGRVKDIIIKGGRNLYPHEVEELAARAEGIRKGCVVAFGLKDKGSGTEKLVIVAESREQDAARRAAIAAAINEEVSRGLGLPPDRVELIPPGSIPKTSSGKLRRDGTKQLYVAGTLTAGRPRRGCRLRDWDTGTFLSGSGAGRGRAGCAMCWKRCTACISSWCFSVDCAFVADRAADQGSEGGGAIYVGALHVLFALAGIRREGDGQGVHGDAGREGVCVRTTRVILMCCR